MKFLILIIIYLRMIHSQSFRPYEIIVDHLDIQKGGKLLDMGTLRVKKYNRTTFVMTGYCDLLIPFSDEITGEFDIFTYQGNEFRKLFDKKTSKMCTSSREDKTFIPKKITKTSLAPEIKSCPLPPQRIHFYDLNMPADFLPIQPPGGEKYRIDIRYLLDGTVVMNGSVYILLKKSIDDEGMLPIPKFG